MSKLNEYLVIAYKRGYRVINGEVISPTGKKRIVSIKPEGYTEFTIKINSKTRHIKVHRLVAYQKYGNRIFTEEVRHLDNNKRNNLDENIGIGTRSQNMLDLPKEKRKEIAKRGTKAARKVNKKYNYEEIKQLHNLGYSYTEIMKATGITSKGTISYIVNS